MLSYVVRRTLHLVPVLFIVSLTLFVLLRLLPGDPTTALLGQEATDDQRDALREGLGLNDPLWQQYLGWIRGILRFDLGDSWLTQESVAHSIGYRLPVTLEIGLLSLLLAVAIGIPMGAWAAVRRGRLADRAVNGLSMLSLATPHFYLATLLILVFAVWLRWLEPSGYVGFTDDPAQNLKYLVLPVVTIGSTIVAVSARQTRGSLVEQLDQEYVRTATAFGLTRQRVVGRYALRNALIPVVTVVGLQIGALISATVVTESIFTLPGMGTLIVDAIFSRDLPIVQGAVLVVVVLVLLVNLVTDLVYAALDPRISYS